MTNQKKPKRPTKAYLDGDILIYKAAFWADSENPDLIPNKVAKDIKKWTPKGIQDIVITLSCNREDNFRRKIWPRYKLFRDDLYRPEYLDTVKEFMLEEYKCKKFDNIEADDIMGIYASSNRGIAVTIDKDLKGVRGWHYNPDKDKEPRYVSPEEAERFFCQQWIAGDSTDGIPGLWRVGPKKADKFLDDWEEDGLEWYEEIMGLYEIEKYQPKDTCGLEPTELAIIMGQCVKILSNENFNLRTKELTLWSPKGGL
mgnify:CR=1 FL=1